MFNGIKFEKCYDLGKFVFLEGNGLGFYTFNEEAKCENRTMNEVPTMYLLSSVEVSFLGLHSINSVFQSIQFSYGGSLYVAALGIYVSTNALALLSKLGHTIGFEQEYSWYWVYEHIRINLDNDRFLVLENKNFINF